MTFALDVLSAWNASLSDLLFHGRFCSTVSFPYHSQKSSHSLRPPLLFIGSPYPPSFSSVQFSSVAQSCPTLWDAINHSTPGLPVYHQFPEFTQTQVHRVSDAIQPSHPGSSPSLPAPNPSQHQSLFQWVNSSREVAKVNIKTSYNSVWFLLSPSSSDCKQGQQ